MHLFRISIPFLITALCASVVLADSGTVAKVNGKPLTAFELNEEFQDILPMMGSYHGGVSEERMAQIRGQALNNLIDKELQYQYALEKGVSVPEKDINSELAKIKTEFGTSRNYKAALKKSGIAEEELRGFIRKRLLAARAKGQEVTSKAALSEADIKEYYQKNRESFKRPVEFRASHILIGVDPAAAKEERGKKLKLANEILDRVKNGEKFADLAMKYSTDEGTAPIGGDIGTFHMGMAEEAFEKAAVSLKVGEVSNVVETLYGYHIIMLTGMKPEAQLEFDDVKGDIKNKLEKKRADELYKKWIENLRANAKIEIIKK